MNTERISETARSSAEAMKHAPQRHILYVSYDGMAEPLGRSQVLAYLFRLSGRFRITLISFEKGEIPSALREEILAAGITWLPQRYHRRPPVVSTLLDVLAGRRAIRRAGYRYDIAHVRSYVSALIALTVGREWWGRLLFDIRGFWVDERVEGGIWRTGGWLYRIGKRCERWFFAQADGVVTLTEASVPTIRGWVGERDVPVEVIPTCVDLDLFTRQAPREDTPHAVWSGSVGTWYRFDLVPPLVEALGLPLTVLTRQAEEASQFLSTSASATVVTRRPEEVVNDLHANDIGLCLIKSSFSKVASAPTRFAEYLAAGMPVVVTPGVGDLEKIVQAEGVGVVLRDGTSPSIQRAAGQIRELGAEPGLADRCRRVAESRFDAGAGSRRYAQLYDRLLSAATRDESAPADARPR